MYKRKIGSGILLVTFITIMCSSWLLWFLLKKFVDTTNYENREPAIKPQLSIDNYKNFSKEYEAYFNDNIPFRNNLITLHGAIDYFIFNKSSNPKVIVGDDDWLFYENIDDGDPIGCYQGINLFSEEQLRIIAQKYTDIESFLNKQGKEFILFIAPNKERVYSEKMPKQYGEPAEYYKALQVVEYLRVNTQIRVVYPYDELMEAKSKLFENIWYKTDTHWNLVGGYIATSALLSELGIEIPDILSDEISIVSGDRTTGDLAAMLNLMSFFKNTDCEYKVIGYNTHNMQTIEWDFYNAIIYHAENADPRKIYVYRDSFSTNMSDYIGSQFTDSYLRHRETYSYDDFVQQDPDIFVYETVERYVGDLLTYQFNDYH